jgi:chorismate dehydratase
VLFAGAPERAPRFVAGDAELSRALERADAAVRIGDKALFEEVPPGLSVHDLGSLWTDGTGLPFVFAAWAARAGVVDRELYEALHDSRRQGSRDVDRIAAEWRWKGRAHPERVRDYLTRHIAYRLGAAEIAGLRLFLGRAAAAGVIAAAPEIRMALARHTACHEAAAARSTS